MAFRVEYLDKDLLQDRIQDLYRIYGLSNKIRSFTFVVNKLGACATIHSLSFNHGRKRLELKKVVVEWHPTPTAWVVSDPEELREAFNKYGFRPISPLEELALAADG